MTEKKENIKPKKSFLLLAIAVVVILVVVFLFVLPLFKGDSIEEKKEKYLELIGSYQKVMAAKLEAGDYDFDDTDTTYYIHLSNIPVKEEGPFGKFQDGYMVVVYDGKDYQYYWTSVDEEGYEISLEKITQISARDIRQKEGEITLSNRRRVGTRKKIVIVNEDGDYQEETPILELSKEEAKKCYIYQTYGEEVTILAYEKTCSKEVEIPSKIDERPVTVIGEKSFANHEITALILPETIEEIKESAFYNNKIEQVEFPSSLRVVEDEAFANNLIIEYPNMSMIDKLGDDVFLNNRCEEAKKFIYKQNYNGTYDYSTIIGYEGTNKDLAIPKMKEGVELRTIENEAFKGKIIETLILPEGLEEIGDESFYGCGITSMEIPSTVKSIGEKAFYGNQLKTLNIPESVTYIGNAAFNGNRLPQDQAIIYARTRRGVDYSTIVSYGGRETKNILIPEQVEEVELKTIAQSAFEETGVQSIILPEGLKVIEENAFYMCKLNTIELPTTLTTIGKNAFKKDEDYNRLREIVNGTGRSFDWTSITGARGRNSFIAGTITHDYGDIEVIKKVPEEADE